MVTSFTKIKKATRQYSLMGFSLVAMGLGACSMDHPTYMVQERAVVEEQLYQQEFFLSQLDPYVVSQIGHKYDEYGDGPVGLTFFYDPEAGKNASRQATKDLGDLSQNLKQSGAENIVSRIVPVEGLHNSKVLVEFNTFTARAAENCPQTIDEINDESFLNHRDYALGCSIESYMAAQVDNPKDLTGREGIGDVHGRRITNVVWGQYVGGGRNPPLDGERTTE